MGTALSITLWLGPGLTFIVLSLVSKGQHRRRCALVKATEELEAARAREVAAMERLQALNDKTADLRTILALVDDGRLSKADARALLDLGIDVSEEPDVVVEAPEPTAEDIARARSDLLVLRDELA